MEPSVGSYFGRYQIIGRLGAGGMGIVVAAHDPELDRRVAIKILRADRPVEDSKPFEHTIRIDRAGLTRDPKREQLLAEARAVARVSHPNLVSVFEVGEVDGQVFLAMELIDGETLTEWLKARRSVPEIVGALVQAGRGLAAAHAAGLVHGDFKPDNALVDRSGRVRVIDFGVARAAGAESGGRAAGTPRYMAPEQIEGEPVDDRADQFALCCVLYEALYGESPFPGSGDGQAPGGRPARSPTGVPPDAPQTVFRMAVRGGSPRRPTRRRGSASLERAVLRGLARDPAARFRSTDDLLAALERSVGGAWVARAAALAALVVTGAAIGAFALAPGETDPCSGVERSLAGVWDPPISARVGQAFAASSRPHAQSSYERTRAALDAYAGSWIDARRSACRAARSGEESSELADRRAACLDSRRLRLGALARNLAGADDQLVDRALEMTTVLDPLDACGDAESLLAGAPAPADPAAREAVRALESELIEAEVLLGAGRAAEAERATSALLARARELAHAPLVASVAYVNGRALRELGRPKEARDVMRESWQAAERAGQAPRAARALIALISIVGIDLAELGEARGFAQAAGAALERSTTRDDPRLRASLIRAQGNLEQLAGNYGPAVEHYRRALALRRSVLPADDPDIASAESDLGVALFRREQFVEADEHLERALAISRRVFGDGHPRTARLLVNTCGSYLLQRRTDEARRDCQLALEVFRRIPEHRDYPAALNHLGAIEYTARRLDDARRYYEEALSIRRRQAGPDHPNIAMAFHNLGGVYIDLGDDERALEVHRQAVDILRRVQGEEHPTYAKYLAAEAEALRRLGRPRRALERAEKGLGVLEKKLGKDHEWTGAARLVVAASLVDLGRHRHAIPVLERSLELLSPANPDRTRAKFHMARALAATGKRRRAAELAGEARRELSQQGNKRDIAILDAWSARARR